jgi:hypothetical protein
MNYQIRVAGVTAENRQKILAALYNHPMLNSTALCFDLVPEPENPYDPNAVAVYIGKKYVVGYVPKGHIFQQKVKDGVKFNVRGVVVGGQDGMNYGIILNCHTDNDNEGMELKTIKRK